MNTYLIGLLAGITALSPTSAQDAKSSAATEGSHRPVQLTAKGAPVRVEAPGYAAPTWADVDGDDLPDLVVGQFNDGKLRVYKNLGKGKLAQGTWLKAGGKVAKIPGVW